MFGEKGIERLGDDKFHVYILRNATAYGASAVLRTDLVVNDLSAGMCAYGVAEIRSDGSPWRPLIHCRDMARAFKLFIENDPTRVNGKPINIGFEEENFQVRDVGASVKKTWEEGTLSYAPTATIDPRDYKVSFDLLKSILPEFLPEHPLNKGIPELRRLLESINYSKVDRDNKRYVRLNEIQKRIGELE